MTKIPSRLLLIIPGVLAVLSGAAISAQDKYTVQVPGGLALSECRGYEDWLAVAVSDTKDKINVIVANPVMIEAYRARCSRQRQAFPRRRQDREDPLEAGKKCRGPRSVHDSAGHPDRPWLHGEGQQEICRQRQLGMGPV
jgi:hypothetical protein